MERGEGERGEGKREGGEGGREVASLSLFWRGGVVASQKSPHSGCRGR